MTVATDPLLNFTQSVNFNNNEAVIEENRVSHCIMSCSSHVQGVNYKCCFACLSNPDFIKKFKNSYDIITNIMVSDGCHVVKMPIWVPVDTLQQTACCAYLNHE